jgi:hypothetical protein
MDNTDTLTIDGETTFFKSQRSEYDPVNRPVHYNSSGIECIDAIEAMTEKMSGFTAPHAANVLKYLWRHQYKNGLEDIDKAIWYLNRLKKRYKEIHK